MVGGAIPLSDRLARALAAAGTTTMFGLPGGGPNLDVVGSAGRQGIRFVLGHGETATAIMASTHASITGTPTAVVVTRGPGATSVANGVAQATLDRFPLIAITDSVPASTQERVAHQRLDQRAMFSPLTKRSATFGPTTTDAELAELLAAATAWPPGAIHLDYDATAENPDPATARNVTVTSAAAAPDRIEAARTLLAGARRPVVIVGMEAVVQAPEIATMLESFGCPVLTTYQAIGILDSEAPMAAGLFTNGALERPVLQAADLIVAIGVDPVEPIPAAWTLGCPVIRISSSEETDPYLPRTVDLVGDVATTAAAVLRGDFDWGPAAGEHFRTAARDWLRPTTASGTFGPIEVVDAALDVRPENLTVTVDAGAHFLAVMPLWPVEAPQRLLISNGLATMGFAVPAAIGAAIARPGDPVLAFTGDGGLGMVLGELETIARLDLPITIVVFDDARLSLIEIKQTAAHGGRDAVRYRPVDFAQMAAAAGLAGESVRSAGELRSALADGWSHPRLISAHIDPAAYPQLIAATRG